MKYTKADGLTMEFEKILTDLSDEAKEAVEEASKEVAKEAAKKLRNSSPKKTGAYAKGWKSKTEKTRTSVKSIVYNATKPQLTHLLEHGHLIVATGKHGGQVVHIAPVEEWANKEFEERVKEALER